MSGCVSVRDVLRTFNSQQHDVSLLNISMPCLKVVWHTFGKYYFLEALFLHEHQRPCIVAKWAWNFGLKNFALISANAIPN